MAKTNLDCEKERSSKHLSMTAIAALVVLELYALSQGINGSIFSGVLLLIGMIAGVNVDKDKLIKKFKP